MEDIRQIDRRFNRYFLGRFKNETEIKDAAREIALFYDISVENEKLRLTPKSGFTSQTAARLLKILEGFPKEVSVDKKTESLSVRIPIEGLVFSGLIQELEKKSANTKRMVTLQKLSSLPKSLSFGYLENGEIEIQGDTAEEVDGFLKDANQETLEMITYLLTLENRGKNGLEEPLAKQLTAVFDFRIVKTEVSKKNLLLALKKESAAKEEVLAYLPVMNDLFRPVGAEPEGKAFLIEPRTEAVAVNIYRLLSPLSKPKTKVAAFLMGPAKDLPYEVKRAVVTFPAVQMGEGADIAIEDAPALKEAFLILEMEGNLANALLILNQNKPELNQEEALKIIPERFKIGLGEDFLLLKLPERTREKLFPVQRRRNSIVSEDISGLQGIRFEKTGGHGFLLPLTLTAAEVYLLEHYGKIGIENGKLLFNPLPVYRQEWEGFAREPEKRKGVKNAYTEETTAFMEGKVGFAVTHEDRNGNIWFDVRKKDLTETEEREMVPFEKGMLNSYKNPDEVAVVRDKAGRGIKAEELTNHFYIENAEEKGMFIFSLKNEISDFEKIRLQDILGQKIAFPEEMDLKDGNCLVGQIRFERDLKVFQRAGKQAAADFLNDRRNEIDEALGKRYELSENDRLYLARKIRRMENDNLILNIPDERYMMPLSKNMAAMLSRLRDAKDKSVIVLSRGEVVRRFKNGKSALGNDAPKEDGSRNTIDLNQLQLSERFSSRQSA